jgi:hypothetical protein
MAWASDRLHPAHPINSSGRNPIVNRVRDALTAMASVNGSSGDYFLFIG